MAAKEFFGMKIDNELRDYIDKLVLLTQLSSGMSRKYTSRTDFFMKAAIREAREIEEELKSIPMLEPVANPILEEFKGVLDRAERDYTP